MLQRTEKQVAKEIIGYALVNDTTGEIHNDYFKHLYIAVRKKDIADGFDSLSNYKVKKVKITIL